MAMHVRRRRSVFGPSPIVLRVLLYSFLLAPCLAAAGTSAPGGSPTAAWAQDILRTKMDLSTTTSTTTTTTTTATYSSLDDLVARGVRVQGQRLWDALRPTASAMEAAIFSDDVSDDEDLTLGSGSGVYVPDSVGETTPRHTALLHAQRDKRRRNPHSTCCFAGKMAASQHLHCLAQYHVDKLRRRGGDLRHVTQRRRGRRMRSFSKLPSHWSRDFEWCVLERPLVFQKCCYGYATAASDKLRWFHHRKARTGSLQNSYLSWSYIYS